MLDDIGEMWKVNAGQMEVLTIELESGIMWYILYCGGTMGDMIQYIYIDKFKYIHISNIDIDICT